MDVLSTMSDANTKNLAPCSHEEPDTRLLLHVANAVLKGYRKLCEYSHSIVVLAIAKFNEIKPDELWLAFGTKSSSRYIPVHKIVDRLDTTICKVLPVFHAFTGCDTVSAFAGRGKKTAWSI